MGIVDFFTGKEKKLGVLSERLETAETIHELQQEVQESTVYLDSLQRQAEDLAWTVLAGQPHKDPGDKELSHENRKKRNQHTERMYREDAFIRRVVNISSEFVWGRGMQKPMARDPRVQRVIDSFWADPDNKLTITSLAAQIATNVDLELHGEVFFLVFDEGTWGNLGIEVTDRQGEGTSGLGDDLESFIREANVEYTEDLSGGRYDIEVTGALPDCPVKLSQIHPNEIYDVIKDRSRQLKPRYYKRVRVPYKYDYKNDEWVPIEILVKGSLTGEECKYYEDFEYPPDPEDGNKPPGSKMGTGKILHRGINKTTHWGRGNSDVWVSVRWAQLLNDYFEWRVTLLRALATFPFKRRVKGGVSAVLQAAQRFTSTQNQPYIPQNPEVAAVPPVGSVVTENESESLEQFKTTSGAGEAKEDILALRAQAGVAIGLPPHWTGDVGSANLANATAMEFPILKHFQARQEFFESLVETLLNHAIKKAVGEKLIPDDADLTFKNDLPEIQERKVPELINSINSIVAQLDPMALNYKLKRFLLLMGLTYLGVNNPQKIVQDVYPPNAEQEELKKIMQAQMMQGGALGGTPTFGNGATPPPEIAPSDLDPMKNKKQYAQPYEELEADLETPVWDFGHVPEGAAQQYVIALSMLMTALEKIGEDEIKRSSLEI